MKERILELLRSSDEEMIFLGVSIAINTFPKKELMEMIPYWGFSTVTQSHVFYINNPVEHIWVKRNVAIMIRNWTMVCRSLEIMKMREDYYKIEKTIYE